MAINVVCPACSKVLKAPDSAAGKRAKCPACGGSITVPSLRASSSAGAGTIPIVEPLPPLPPEPASLAGASNARPAGAAVPPTGTDKINVPCLCCGKTLKAPASMAGKRSKCPACGGSITIPARTAAEIGLADGIPRVASLEPLPAIPAASAIPAMNVSCPHCKSTWNAPAAKAGQRLKCPHCAGTVTLPEVLLDAEVVEPEEQEYSLAQPTAGPASSSSPFTDEDFAIAKPSAAAEPDRQPCPMCGELIATGAAKCRFCNAIFDSALRKAEEKKKKKEFKDEERNMTAGDWVVAILCSGIGCIAGLIWIIQGKPKGGKMLAVSLVCAVLWNVINVVLQSAMHSSPGLR